MRSFKQVSTYCQFCMMFYTVYIMPVGVHFSDLLKGSDWFLMQFCYNYSMLNELVYFSHVMSLYIVA